MLLIENCAAEYIRMSTDMQRYSIDNQSEAIALYAARRGLTIVRSYVDAGKSGLSTEKRDALQRLIFDVRSGAADFQTILVFDVSRWGRFQDVDESAYFEFLCKEMGVRVQYCAEQFENDGSLAANIIKNIKRAMAGEFSRELSAKVFAGQCRSVRAGNYMGSMPGFGLRRALLDQDGQVRQEMGLGQRKVLSTDRTVLVPGPASEIAVVHDIFQGFVDRKMSLSRIASDLNARGILNAYGRKWSDVAIRNILSNEKYVGTSLFNRTSRRLNSKPRRNPVAEWVRSPGAFEPIISKDQFQKAQLRLKDNARAYTGNELLDSLSALWCREGKLSAAIIDSSQDMPRVNTYKVHFGGLASAYQKVGYRAQFSQGRSSMARMMIVADIVFRLRESGATVEQMSGRSEMIINDELRVAVVTCCAQPGCGKNQWPIGRPTCAKPDILVVARVHDERSLIEEYILVPMLFLMNSSWLTISNARLRRLKTLRSATIDPLIELCGRARLEAT